MFAGRFLQIEPNAPNSVWWIIVCALATVVGVLANYIRHLHKEAKADAKDNLQEYKKTSERLEIVVTNNTLTGHDQKLSIGNLTDATNGLTLIIREALKELKK